MPQEKLSSADPIERVEPWSRALKGVALIIRIVGGLLGVGLAAVYLLMMWVSPPDLSHSRPGAAFGMYVGLPILFLFGPFWLADWLAGFVDKRHVMD
jgi:hypothetical protein